jgi:hypothetical protein
MWRVHRHIGMGGNRIVAALIGEQAEELRRAPQAIGALAR